MMRRRPILTLSLLVVGFMAAPATSHAAFLTGIGDQQSAMFSSPLYRALNTKIVRYIAPYDAMRGGLPEDRARARDFLGKARAQNKRILVAFYHSRKNPTKIPSTKTYTSAVKAFRKAFPYVKEYQPWNEANRGTVRNGSKIALRSPSAKQSAGFYKALKANCSGCKLTGLDLLDGQNIKPSLAYLRAFQKAVRPSQPKIWGLHNYSDTNRNSSTRTKAFLKAVKGEVWLTETGGIVKFGKSFPGGSTGEARAARALKKMFSIAKSSSRIKRLYIFQWTGSGPDERFDAGLTDINGNARPGYKVVKDRIGK